MRRLVELPLRKSFYIAWQSLRVRFFRAMVTTMSLVLAVAFFCFTQAGNTLALGLLADPGQQFHHALDKAGYDISVTPSASSTASTASVAFSGSAKQRWVVVLSLLVCVVGIVNAQLMSVTERFREIGTLKCLGALDRFIVRIFLIEAALQGIAGGIAGALLGILIALLSFLFRFGLQAIPLIPWQGLLVTATIGMVGGTLLSLLGVLYPALLAARMEPVNAMRVEQ